MRAWPLLLVAAGTAACSFDPHGVASDAFVDTHDDGGGTAATWRADSTADFAAGTNVDAVVEPWGAIGPAAYLTGEVLARGSDSQLFTSTDGDTWATLAAASAAGQGLSSLAPIDWGNDRPRGVGVTGSDSFTYWLEGELWLDAGSQTFSLYGDDLAFVDLAPPGGTFTRVLAAAYPNPLSVPYVAPTSGWYGLHVGMSEGFGNASLQLTLAPPGTATPRPIPPDRIRVRADALAGLAWTAYDDEGLLAPVPPLLWSDSAFDYAPDDNALAELGLTDHDHWSMRWAGQVRIDVAGSYQLHLDTDDGQRLWIDGGLALDHFGENPEDHTTTKQLDVGWHDLVADLRDNTGAQHVRLTVMSGPELSGSAFPAERVRPVVPRLERAASAVDGNDVAIPDLGGIAVALAPGAPTGAMTTAVEVGVTIDHPKWSDLEIAAIAPDGTVFVAAGAGSLPLTGPQTLRVTVPIPGAVAAAGGWQVRIKDVTAQNTGTLQNTELTVRYRGGAAPIVPTAVWTSPPIDLGAVVGIDAVRWDGRIGAPATVSVRARSCDDAPSCASADWSPPMTTSGGKPAVQTRRFVQLEVTLGSDGDVTPSIDYVELAYRHG